MENTNILNYWNIREMLDNLRFGSLGYNSISTGHNEKLLDYITINKYTLWKLSLRESKGKPQEKIFANTDRIKDCLLKKANKKETLLKQLNQL